MNNFFVVVAKSGGVVVVFSLSPNLFLVELSSVLSWGRLFLFWTHMSKTTSFLLLNDFITFYTIQLDFS